jgi:hypothetical protein
MKSGSAVWLAAAAVLCASAPAYSAQLTVVQVNAPAVNCVFNPACTVVVTDSVSTLQFTPYGAGAFLQSRTYAGQPGTPGAGLIAYEYRLDFTQALPFTECVAGLVLNFGPVQKLTYPPNQPAHAYVIVQGGIGSVGIETAEQDGDVVTFTFKPSLCPGASTRFFGMAAGKSPMTVTPLLFKIGTPAFYELDARVPQH